MKRSLVIHLTDLFSGWQFNGEGKWLGRIGTGGNFPGLIVWVTISIGNDFSGSIDIGDSFPGGDWLRGNWHWENYWGGEFSREPIVGR